MHRIRDSTLSWHPIHHKTTAASYEDEVNYENDNIDIRELITADMYRGAAIVAAR